jgi:chromosome segregation ATPase
LKRQCGDKESELSAVLNQVATLREQLTKAEEDIAMASAAEVERLREECRKKEEKIGELEAQSRQIETLLDKLRAALAEKEREAQTVKSELEEREATLNDIMDKLRMALGEEVAEGLGQQRKADLGEIHRLQLEVEILKGGQLVLFLLEGVGLLKNFAHEV